jgi:hypothetical protein
MPFEAGVLITTRLSSLQHIPRTQSLGLLIMRHLVTDSTLLGINLVKESK